MANAEAQNAPKTELQSPQAEVQAEVQAAASAGSVPSGLKTQKKADKNAIIKTNLRGDQFVNWKEGSAYKKLIEYVDCKVDLKKIVEELSRELGIALQKDNVASHIQCVKVVAKQINDLTVKEEKELAKPKTATQLMRGASAAAVKCCLESAVLMNKKLGLALDDSQSLKRLQGIGARLDDKREEREAKKLAAQDKADKSKAKDRALHDTMDEVRNKKRRHFASKASFKRPEPPTSSDTSDVEDSDDMSGARRMAPSSAKKMRVVDDRDVPVPRFIDVVKSDSDVRQFSKNSRREEKDDEVQRLQRRMDSMEDKLSGIDEMRDQLRRFMARY